MKTNFNDFVAMVEINSNKEYKHNVLFNNNILIYNKLEIYFGTENLAKYIDKTILNNKTLNVLTDKEVFFLSNFKYEHEKMFLKKMKSNVFNWEYTI